MTIIQFYLTKYAEECLEVSQALIDVIQTDFNLASIKHFFDELDDLSAVNEELVVYGLEPFRRNNVGVGIIVENDTRLVLDVIRLISKSGQTALKAQQFGVDEVCPGQPLTNIQRLSVESRAAYEFIQRLKLCGLTYKPDSNRIISKKDKMKHYLKYSRSLGLVQ